MTLFFLVVPSVTLTILQKEVEYRETARLNCAFSGNPSPNITWSFKNDSLSASSKYNISKNGNASILLVENLTRTDEGNYSCFAVNSLGNDSKTTELIVLSKYWNF